MPKYYVGDFIKETRERRGYTQEELCYGICSIPSLSRIENGTQVPGSRKLDALMERLGCNNQVFNEFVSKEEAEMYATVRKIRNAIIINDFEELENCINNVESYFINRCDFDSQYFFLAKATLMKYQCTSKEEIMNMYLKAIHITLPEFDGITPLENNLLTFDEITIINGIASLYADSGKMWEALQLGFWLKRYMEKRVIDESERKKKYPMILFNLTNWLGVERRYADVVEIADCGIEFCSNNGALRHFPVLIFNKACALAELGEKDLAKKFFIQAIVIFDSIGNAQRKQKAIAWCKENYSINIII